jgi:transposase-like protein
MKTRRGKQRDPLREQFWRRTLADQARSDLTVQAYCRRHSLNPATLRFWRQELARRDAESTPTRTGERPASPTDLERTPAFLPVRVVQDSPAPIAVGSPIEIVLPSGPIVRVTHGFSPNALDAVLSMLEARRC